MSEGRAALRGPGRDGGVRVDKGRRRRSSPGVSRYRRLVAARWPRPKLPASALGPVAAFLPAAGVCPVSLEQPPPRLGSSAAGSPVAHR